MSLGKPPIDRRRHPRAITRFSALLTIASRQYDTRVINLSLGGALLDFLDVTPDPPVPVGERVHVNLRCRGGSSPVSLEGRTVLWHAKADTAPLLAIQFDEVSGEDEEALEDLIAEALAELEGRADGFPATVPAKADDFWR